MNLPDYNRLKEQADRMQREYDRSQGALDQLNSRLKDEFGVDATAGRKLLAKLEKQVAEAEKEYGKVSEAFEAKWKERLQG